MSLLIVIALSTSAAALDYTFSAPTQCDPFTVKYSDGQPPFTLQLSAGFANPIIVKLPDSAYNGKSGSYTMQLNIAAGKDFIITMYDKTGFAKGINSGVLTVGSSRTNQTCDLTQSSPDFTYGAPDALTQCLNYQFNDYGNAKLPVTVNGIIAGGNVFQRTSGAKDVQFSTLIDIRASTRLIFWMQDAQGRSGGATEILTVLSSPNSTCIKPDSPGTTQSPTPSQLPSRIESGASVGAIAAAIIGTLIAFAAIGAFVFYRRRRRSGKDHVMAEPYHIGHSRQSSRFSRRTPSVDLLSANRGAYERTPGLASPSTPSRGLNPSIPPSPSVGETGRAHEGALEDISLVPDPFITPRTPSSFSSQQHQQSEAHTRRSSTSKAPYGAGGRPAQGAPRFIVHTDAGAVAEPHEEEEDIVELPPMYVDTRSQASREASASATGSGSKQRFPLPPPMPNDSNATRPISYNSAVTMPRGAYTERTMSFGGASTVATGYDDPMLERSASQRVRSSYASSHRAMSSDGSQRPLRMHNPDDDDEEEDEPNPAGGSSHPQYDFLDDEYDRPEDESDVQLAYDGPEHPLAPGPSTRPKSVRQNTGGSTRKAPSRQNSGKPQ